MKTLVRLGMVCVLAPAAAVLGQAAPDKGSQTAQPPAVSAENPLTSWNKLAYARVKDILMRSAQKMPEENYGFKPVDTVRSYGQIVGHLADAQYLFCSIALGEKNPGLDIEHSKTTKADLIASLTAAFAYCDKAYDTMTDATGAQMIKLFGNDAPRFSALEVNNMHNLEHYGNLATYMRIKGMVPPSSEQPPQAQAPAKKQ
ncbi:MAG TPA: DinB family protein [Candidatus Acidoferrum sp.]|nr:DinB family protein [Candidatus Acidoferrum sp.]